MLAKVQRGHTKFVLVVQEPSRDDVIQCVDLLAPDMIQFHGTESPEFAESFGLPYIKATRCAEDVAHLRKHTAAFAHMLDSETIDGNETLSLPRLIIAGGLTCEIVAERIAMLKPWGVDVSRGIERYPGVKDEELMSNFLRTVRGRNA
jgi:phosphoribosylanthranilate isomerase